MPENKDKNQKGEHGNRVLELTINGKKYEWDQQYITGAEIRKLGNMPSDDEIFLAVKKPWEDEPIPDDKQVNLARPEIEHFYSKVKEVIIVVNGTPHKWTKGRISFKEVIILAFGQYIDNPTMVYTVAYEDGPKQNHEGSMFAGQEVFVKNKIIFNATATDKS
jgi:Multiubiquitin